MTRFIVVTLDRLHPYRMRCARVWPYPVALGVVLMLLGCSSIKQAGYDVPFAGTLFKATSNYEYEVGDPFILAMSDGPLVHGHYSYPQVRKFPDGTLMIAWFTGNDVNENNVLSIDEKGDLVVRGSMLKSPAISMDDGLTWETRLPTCLTGLLYHAPGIYRMNSTMDPSLAQPIFGWTTLSDGTKLGFGRNVYRIQNLKGQLPGNLVGIGAEWTPEGKMIGPFNVSVNAPDVFTPSSFALRIMHRGFEGPDGTLYLPAYCHYMLPYKNDPNGPRVAMILASKDRGRSFDIYSIIATAKNIPWARDGAGEVMVLPVTDQEWIGLIRSNGTAPGPRPGVMGAQNMLFVRSEDQGKTWKHRMFNRSGVWPTLHRLSNGLVACSYGRPGNSIMFSEDDGKSWLKTITLTPADVATSGYVDFEEVSPGRILVAYDEREYIPEGSGIRFRELGNNVVYGRFIEIRKKDEATP